MLRKNQKALQVLVDGNWQYLFCHNGGRLVTTNDRRKALNADYDLNWFENHFGNNQFRAQKESEAKNEK